MIEKRLAALAWEVGAKVAGIITKVVQVHNALWVSVKSRQASKT